jgi:hypothetical protein
MRSTEKLRTFALLLIAVLATGLLGCEANGLRMIITTCILIGASAGSLPTLVTAATTVQKYFRRRVIDLQKARAFSNSSAIIGPDSPDAEVMALIEEYMNDVSRWENEGGA